MSNALSVHLPRWPIRLAQRRRRQMPGEAIDRAADLRRAERAEAWLLVESIKGNEVVACACERAETMGVRAGMTVAHAQSLLRGGKICMEPYTPDKDARQLRRLAEWALRFSPIAAPDEPDGLLLDISGCGHLYGGEVNLAEQVGGSLQKLGFDARIAIAPTFACAQAISMCANHRITLIETGEAREALSPLPIAALRVNPQTCESLSDVGIERIGQLLDMPRTELSVRFGGALIRRIDQALGSGGGEFIEPVRRCEPLEVSRVFDGPVTCLEVVQYACHDLLTTLIERLVRQESGVCGLTFFFHRVDSAPTSFTLRLTHPSRNEKHLWSLILLRLEQLHLGFGIEEIQLRAERVERVAHDQVDLWPDVSATTHQPHASSWAQLLDHLIERLGLENVSVAEPAETYIPERAFPLHSVNESAFNDSTHKAGASRRNVAPLLVGGAATDSSPPTRDGATGMYQASRPSRLLSEPEPIRVMTVTPDGPLVWIHWRGSERLVYRCLGPERISIPWWEQKANHIAAVRDYYVIVSNEGDWLWVFRDGESGNWFVHGEWT